VHTVFHKYACFEYIVGAQNSRENEKEGSESSCRVCTGDGDEEKWTPAAAAVHSPW
jgi:hypothetical protein